LPDINSRNNGTRTTGGKAVSHERHKELQLPQAPKPPRIPKSLRETASQSAHNQKLKNDGGKKLKNMGGQKNGFEISNYIMQYEQDRKDTAYHLSQ